MTHGFLSVSREQANDLGTPRPGLKLPERDAGNRWSLCPGRWIEARDATQAKPLPVTTLRPGFLQAPYEAVVDSVALEALESHSRDA